MKGTWQTTSGGGGEIGLIIAVIAAAVVAVPVIHAVTALVQALVIAIFAVLGLALTAGAAVLVYRVRHRGAPRPLPVHRVHEGSATAKPLPAAPPRAIPTRDPMVGIDPPREVHLHFHGVTADDAAAIIRKAGE